MSIYYCPRWLPIRWFVTFLEMIRKIRHNMATGRGFREPDAEMWDEV